MLKYRAILPFAGPESAQYGGAGEGVSDGSIQVFTADLRFKKMVGRTQLHRRVIDGTVSLTSEKDEGFIASLKQGVSQEVESGLGAEAIIDEIEVIFFLANERQRLIVVPALIHQEVLIGNTLYVFTDNEEVGVVIINDKYPDRNVVWAHQTQAD